MRERERERRKHTVNHMEVEGKEHLGRYNASMGPSNTGEYVSFTNNIRPVGVALRSAYARGRPSR